MHLPTRLPAVHGSWLPHACVLFSFQTVRMEFMCVILVHWRVSAFMIHEIMGWDRWSGTSYQQWCVWQWCVWQWCVFTPHSYCWTTLDLGLTCVFTCMHSQKPNQCPWHGQDELLDTTFLLSISHWHVVTTHDVLCLRQYWTMYCSFLQ